MQTNKVIPLCNQENREMGQRGWEINISVHGESCPEKSHLHSSLGSSPKDRMTYCSLSPSHPDPVSTTHLVSDSPHEATKWPFFLLKSGADLVQSQPLSPETQKCGSRKGREKERKQISENRECS